jgi:hypothetical protein
MEKRIPTYRIVVNPDDEKTGVYAVSLVDEPAIEVDWIKLSKEIQDFEFSVNKDKQMLFGPLLIPNKLIFRRDEKGNEYNIVFDEDTIQIIADKYNENKLGDVFNFQHSDRKVQAVLLQNWITGEVDKSKEYGFELPKGTWFGGVKVKDEEFWMSEVKTEKVKGFSVEIMAGTELIEMTAEADKNKNEQLMEYKTRDGLTLTWEGDAAVGKEVFLVLEDGTKVSADNGEYELEDGTKLVVSEGKVAEIKPVEVEAGNDEEMAEPVATETPSQPTVDVMEIVKPIFEEMRTIIAELSSRIDKLENVEPTTEEESTLSKVRELEDKVEVLSKMAGAPSITKTKTDSEIKRENSEKHILARVEFLKNLQK